MIEIKKLTNRDLNSIANGHYNNLISILNKRLHRFSKLNKIVIHELSKNLELIIKGTPNELFQYNVTFNSFTKKNRCFKKTNQLLPKIFNYEAYIKNLVDTYSLAKQLNVNTCPYCNRNYTVTVEKKKSSKKPHIVRPDFDHFFPKSKYPLLALSFYNLIPCCSLCNSRVKGDVDMTLSKHIHPYVEGFDSSLVFNYTPNNVDSMLGLSTNLEIDLVSEATAKGDRCKTNAELFKLKDIYGISHTDEVADIIRKFHISSGRYLETLAKQFPQLGTVEELYKIAFANYYQPTDFGKRPLSKLTKDIFEQLKFIIPK